MVRNASFCFDRLFERRNIGKTSYERRSGRKFKHKMVPFAEPVFYRRAGDTRTKFEPMWSCGIWLGRHDTSNEHLVGTKFGTIQARCIRRMPQQLRSEKMSYLLDEMIGQPWDTRGARELESSAYRTVDSPEAPAGPVGRATQGAFPKTAGCHACETGHGNHNKYCKAFKEIFLQEKKDKEDAAAAAASSSSAPAAEQGGASAAAAPGRGEKRKEADAETEVEMSASAAAPAVPPGQGEKRKAAEPASTK